MTEQALADDGPPKVFRVRAVITGTRSPIAALLCVPTYRQFDQFSLRSTAQITAHVIARPHHIVDTPFHHICLFAAEADLIPLLEEVTIAPGHREMAV